MAKNKSGNKSALPYLTVAILIGILLLIVYGILINPCSINYEYLIVLLILWILGIIISKNLIDKYNAPLDAKFYIIALVVFIILIVIFEYVWQPINCPI